MKVLLDACVWGKVAIVLRQLGHDVICAGEWPADPGDAEILRRAHEDHRVLVTLDKDFGELAVVRRISHSGIVRLVGFSAREQGPVCVEILDRFGEELVVGAIVTAEPGRIRVRPKDVG